MPDFQGMGAHPGTFSSILVLTLLLFSIVAIGMTESRPPAEQGSRGDPGFEAHICTWKGNRSAALSLTFDDALASQAELAAPLLSNFSLNGTFFITVGNIGIPSFADWSDWQTVADMGHEIASHTITHPDMRGLDQEGLVREVFDCKSAIVENLTGVDCLTFSYPYGLYDDRISAFVGQHHISARSDAHNITPPPRPEGADPSNMFGVVPCNFGSRETASQMDLLLDQAVDMNGWLVEMLHAIEAGGYDPVRLSELTLHLEHIASREDAIWTGTFGEISKYVRERQGTELAVSRPAEDTYMIGMSSGLDAEVFDEKLTIDIQLPSDFVDVRCLIDGEPFEVDPIRKGGRCHFYIEATINSTILIQRNNSYPILVDDLFVQGSDLTFFPPSGNSSTVFEFRAIYISLAGRAPFSYPVCIFDLDSDGDADDIVHGVPEGPRVMTKVDPYDTDYFDGCEYRTNTTFPPGSNISFTFSARDTEGLLNISGGGLRDVMAGPVINDPPSSPRNITIADLHDRTPEVRWERSTDPDGDTLAYKVSVSAPMSGQIWSGSTGNGSIEIGAVLDFGIGYQIEIRSIDGRGAVSRSERITFELANAPPGLVSELRVDGGRTLSPVLHFLAATDPDGDRTSHLLNVSGPGGPVLEGVDLGELTGSVDCAIPCILEDHTRYGLEVQAVDEFKAAGPRAVIEFYVNIPPSPIELVQVEDALSEEDALDISWNASEEADIGGYLLYRFDGIDIEKRDLSSGTVMDLGNVSFFRDRGVVDGLTYGYAVIPYDRDRCFDHLNYSIFRGVPKDDLPPDRVGWIKAHDVENASGSIRIEWEPCTKDDLGGYHVHRSDVPIDGRANTTPIATILAGDNSTEWIDAGVENNRTYHYAVTTFDLSGNEHLTGLVWVEGISLDDGSNEGGQDDDVKENGDQFLWLMVFTVLVLVTFIPLIYILMSMRHRKAPNQAEE